MSDLRIHLLSTSALPDSLIDAAATNGIRIDAVPFIATEPVSQPALEELLGRPLTAIFTSKNAVNAMPQKGGRGWKIYCIGNMAAQRFGEAAITATAVSAKALAEKIIRTGKTRTVYFFCGDQRRDELPDMLRNEGFTVNEFVVYRTIPTPKRLKQQYDGIGFYSPSAVDSFFSVNTVSPETAIFAIGETTAAAVRRNCTNPVKIGPRDNPDKKEIIKLMIEHFSL